MASNRLRLNPAKTEFIWCSLSKMSHRDDQVTPFLIDRVALSLVKSVKLFSVHKDSKCTMTAHVSHTVSECYYQLRHMIMKADRSSTIAAVGICQVLDHLICHAWTTVMGSLLE